MKQCVHNICGHSDAAMCARDPPVTAGRFSLHAHTSRVRMSAMAAPNCCRVDNDDDADDDDDALEEGAEGASTSSPPAAISRSRRSPATWRGDVRRRVNKSEPDGCGSKIT
eukprot:3885776-Pyramimonas_sp.AAC.1